MLSSSSIRTRVNSSSLLPPPRFRLSYWCTLAVGKIVGVQALEVQVKFLNKRIRIVRSEQAIITFLDRINGRVHDAVLLKFLNAFFTTLLECNCPSLSPNRAKSETQKFARKFDKDTPFYEDEQYLEACSAASATALHEILAAGLKHVFYRSWIWKLSSWKRLLRNGSIFAL